MVRPNRRAAPRAGSTSPSDADQRSEHAAATLAAGRFREAIELYKALLKVERRAEWVDGLAASYAGRANDLAEKGMLPEALAVWRNRASLCGKPLVEGRYIEWLVRSGDHAGALSAFAAQGDEAAGSTASEREARLAAFALVASPGALATLSADSLLCRHRAAALAALAACGRGDLAELEVHLRAIPYRSPYRDLRFVFKALLLVQRDPAQAGELLARVAPDSPFEKLAAVARAAILPGNRWLVALLDLDAEGRQLLFALKGCPENRRALMLEVAQIVRRGTLPKPGEILDLLLPKWRGVPSVAFLCRRLLPHAMQRVRAYEAAYGRLSEAELASTQALADGIDGYHGSARKHWLAAVTAFINERQPLPAALILRHLSTWRLHASAEEPFDAQRAAWLQHSLELDPDDRATHVRLIRLLRQKKDLKDARAAVEAALARFVNDSEILLEAVETALAGNAFKKAVSLATRLLELDPINSQVRAAIGQAHLAHARKQFKAKRLEAMSKEIDLAEKWLLTPAERGRARLLRGLSDNTPEATLLLRTAVSELGGELPATLHLLLENARLGGEPAAALRRAAISTARTPTAREVVAALHVIGTTGKADNRHLVSALRVLQAPLKRAAQGEFTSAELVAVCETWLRRGENVLLRVYAEAGLRHWPGMPALVYLRARALYGRNAYFHLPEAEERALDRASERAEKDGDQRTVQRIRELLAPPVSYNDAFDDDEFDDDPGEEGDGDGRAGGLPSMPELIRMLKSMLEMADPADVINLARAFVPDADFRRLQRTAGSNAQKFARLLIDYLSPGVDNASGPAPAPPPTHAPNAGSRPPEVDDRQGRLFDD
ncbi:MAG TPA: hypothetical protein PKL62_07455 [Accumulibacter sp.]|uniref:hypothetical protein n=1 Tax=Accumulibacter sp. TaxID=2053492 RepID=UPI002B8095C2|nr:hypothetical protein [Accumulibacter sp.]HNN83979.1 hypothetical protein [Accumulibacter sp.]